MSYFGKDFGKALEFIFRFSIISIFTIPILIGIIIWNVFISKPNELRHNSANFIYEKCMDEKIYTKDYCDVKTSDLITGIINKDEYKYEYR